MPTSRRDTLKYLLALVGAPLASQGCTSTADISARGRSGAFYTPQELAWVSRISDLMLPATSTPGALAAGVPEFMDGLMSGWANATTRADHRNHLHNIAQALDGSFENFVLRDRSEAYARLDAFDAAAFATHEADPIHAVYRDMKQLLTNAYFVSEPGAAQELDWQLVPGRWDPAVEIGV